MDWNKETEYGTYSIVLLPFKKNRKVDEYDVLILCQLDIYFLKLSNAYCLDEISYLYKRHITSLSSKSNYLTESLNNNSAWLSKLHFTAFQTNKLSAMSLGGPDLTIWSSEEIMHIILQ
jgi:hypothetical protein